MAPAVGSLIAWGCTLKFRNSRPFNRFVRGQFRAHRGFGRGYMAKARNRTHVTLLCLLAVTACAEGTPSIADTDQLTDSNAGSTSGSSGAQALGGGSSGAGVSAGAAGSAASSAGGSFSAAGSPSAGSSSGGTSDGAQGGASGSATAGASTVGGTSMGGNATAGAGSAGKGGSAAGGSGGSMTGSGGGAAACSGAKPESNCVCHSNSNHDYWFCPTARDFADAESKCVGAGLHLVKISSATEDKWVNDTANAATFGEYYLGSTDASTPNTWTWLAGGTFWTGLANGTASGYAHWGASQPDGSGDCVVVQNNFVWDDRICTDHRLYICD